MSKLKTARLKTAALLFSSLLNPDALALQESESFNESKMSVLQSSPELAEFSTLIFITTARMQQALPCPSTPLREDVSDTRPSKSKPPQLKIWIWQRNTSSLEQLGQD